MLFHLRSDLPEELVLLVDRVLLFKQFRLRSWQAAPEFIDLPLQPTYFCSSLAAGCRAGRATDGVAQKSAAAAALVA